MVEDPSDHGECKAALITYYQGPNTAESAVEETKARRQGAEEVEGGHMVSSGTWRSSSGWRISTSSFKRPTVVTTCC